MHWYLKAIRNYLTLHGRASRQEYWMFVLYNIIISVALYIIGHKIGGGDKPIGIYGLLVLLPTFSLSVRRLHDVNRSGWYVLLGLIPILGPLTLLYFKCRSGDQDENNFGAPPLQQ